jgi:hypothetical protein
VTVIFSATEVPSPIVPSTSEVIPATTAGVGMTAVVGTAVVAGTAVAAGTADAATEVVPTETPEPPVGGGLSPLQLKYLLIDKYGPVGARPGIFYCDPDFYPVARADEQSQAEKWFTDVDKGGEEFRLILQRLHLLGATSFSAQQRLQIYQEHKHLNAIMLSRSGDAYTFALRVAQDANSRAGQALQGTITPKGDITVLNQQPTVLTCPICLAQGTRIDTPLGPVAVQDVQPGTLVWTVSRSGERVAMPVVATTHTPVPAGFQVIDLHLADGRELFASPGHPTADGRTLGTLSSGDVLDGVRVVSVDRVLYPAAETYDLLPAGETGYYWAGSILVGSTLAPASASK